MLIAAALFEHHRCDEEDIFNSTPLKLPKLSKHSTLDQPAASKTMKSMFGGMMEYKRKCENRLDLLRTLRKYIDR